MLRLLAILLLLPAFAGAVVVDLPVDRDPAAYFILGGQRVRLKDLTIEPPGCSIGVNCPVPQRGGNRCGVLNSNGSLVPGPGQVVGDRVCIAGAPGSLFAVFRNDPRTCGLTCSLIQNQGPQPDCTFPFTPPILDDLDH